MPQVRIVKHNHKTFLKHFLKGQIHIAMFLLCFDMFLLCFAMLLLCFAMFLLCFCYVLLCFAMLLLCFAMFLLCFCYVLLLYVFLLCLALFMLCSGPDLHRFLTIDVYQGLASGRLPGGYWEKSSGQSYT